MSKIERRNRAVIRKHNRAVYYGLVWYVCYILNKIFIYKYMYIHLFKAFAYGLCNFLLALLFFVDERSTGTSGKEC